MESIDYDKERFHVFDMFLDQYEIPKSWNIF